MKFVLVTGGASGIGFLTCKTLAEKGYTVFACDINEVGLNSLQKPYEDRISPFYMDITKEETIASAYEKIKKITGKLDAVINCAGISLMGSLIEEDPKNTQRVLDINLLGMMRVNKTFFPLLQAAKGRIITISSECGRFSPTPFNGPYTISKYAVEAYNDSLRRELNFLGLKVIKIQPGSFKTNMHTDTKKVFVNLKNQTKLFEPVLNKMEKLMDNELNHAGNPEVLIKIIVKALESKHPKIRYKVKNSKVLGLLSLFPEKLIDTVYVKFFG